MKSLIDSAEFMKIAKLNSPKKVKNSLSDKKSNNKSNDIDKLENKNPSKFIASNYDKFQIKDISLNDESFFEIPPLEDQFDFNSRKELTSKPLNEYSLPANIFMIVDKNIELNIFL